MSIVQANVPPSPLSRQGRELAHIGQATEIAVARANAIAEVEGAILDGLQLITAGQCKGWRSPASSSSSSAKSFRLLPRDSRALAICTP
jgi:hypothetical protein